MKENVVLWKKLSSRKKTVLKSWVRGMARCVSLTVSSLALALAYIGSGEDDNIVTGSCWNCICVDDQLS